MSTRPHEIDARRTELLRTYPDSWWLSLFLPRQINTTFTEWCSVGFDEHQPMLLGETLIASDGVCLAWCPWDDKCPWLIEPLKRDTKRANNIRAVASLAMQASQTVHSYSLAVDLVSAIARDGDTVTLNRQKYSAERLLLVYQLPDSDYACGSTLVNREPNPGLFFRWGRSGGGFLLPMADG